MNCGSRFPTRSQGWNGPPRVGRIIEGKNASLIDLMAPLRKVAEEARNAFLGTDPQEIEVEFGVKFSAEAKVILAKAGGEGHLQVKVVWKPGSMNKPGGVESR